jgi:nucleoid-associated protein YgaU
MALQRRGALRRIAAVGLGVWVLVSAGCSSPSPEFGEVPPAPESADTDWVTTERQPDAFGGGSVTASAEPSLSTPPVVPGSSLPENSGNSVGGRTHVLKRGDTLMSLARYYYNDASKWRAIHEANLDQIQDPNVVYVGQTLVIP